MYPVLDTNNSERCRYDRGGAEKSNSNDSKFKKLIIWGKIEKVGYVFCKAKGTQVWHDWRFQNDSWYWQNNLKLFCIDENG